MFLNLCVPQPLQSHLANSKLSLLGQFSALKEVAQESMTRTQRCQPTLHLKPVQLRRCSRQSHHLLCDIARVTRLSRVLVWWGHMLMSHRFSRSRPSPIQVCERLQLASCQKRPSSSRFVGPPPVSVIVICPTSPINTGMTNHSSRSSYRTARTPSSMS